MDWIWQAIPIALAIIAVGIYAALRHFHIARLQKAAHEAVHLPPAKMLSWTSPGAVQQVVPRVPQGQRPQAIDAPKLPSPESEGGAEGTRGFDRRTGLAAATLDAAIASLPSLHDLAAIDWSVADGVRLSAASGLDLSRWSDLRSYVDSHYFDVGEPGGFLNRLVGYVGEAKAGDHLASQGAEVLFNESPNVPGYDLTVDGNPLQVKVGGTAETFGDHFEKYPDIPVVTGTDNIDIVPDGADVSFLDALDADQVHAATEGSLEIIHDDFDAGEPVIPYVTAIRSSLEQVGLMVEGHTNLTTAAKNVGLDTAGVGLGGWAGAKLGAVTGSLFGPVGTAVGGILGALAGAVGGRAFTNEFKYADFKASAEAYEKAVVGAQQSIQSRQLEAHALLVAKVERQQGDLRRYIEAIQSKLKAKMRGCHHWQESRCVAFVKVFPKVLARVEATLRKREQAELRAYKRSSFIRRLLWPRLDDVKHRLVRDSFRQRIRAVSAAKAEFNTLALKTPAEVAAGDAIRRIERFVHDNPFESADFDNVCNQLRHVTETVQAQERRLKEQANALAQSEYAKRVAAVRKRFQEVARELSEFVGKQAKAVTSAKDKLIREAHKVGIDLESQPET